MRPERLDFRPEGPDKGGDARTNGQTNESPPVFYRTSSPSGPLPKKQEKKFYKGKKERKKDGKTDRKTDRLIAGHLKP